MTRMTTDPWRLMQVWQDQLAQNQGLPTLHDQSSLVPGDWTPAVDIREEAEKYVVTADIPGVDPDKIELFMENNMLTIKGERKHEKTVEKESFKRTERSFGSFYRRFTLPEDTDPELISANGKDGVLEITIPKVEKQKTRRIEIKPQRNH